MGLFSLFLRATQEEIVDELSHKIVISALNHRIRINALNNQVSAEAGAELVYLLLHVMFRKLFQALGPDRSFKLFRALSLITIERYCDAVLSSAAPVEVHEALRSKMASTLDDRQEVYAHCTSLFADGTFPSRGTIMFAFCFFKHRAMSLTSRDDVIEILRGKRDLRESDVDAFPNPLESANDVIEIVEILSAMRLPDVIKKLGRCRLPKTAAA